jgi:hypothetical protein
LVRQRAHSESIAIAMRKNEAKRAPLMIRRILSGFMAAPLWHHRFLDSTRTYNGVIQNVGRLEGCPPTHSAPDCFRTECRWLAHSVEVPNDGSDGTPPIWEDYGCVE